MINSWEVVKKKTIIKSLKKYTDAVFEGSDNSLDKSNMNGDVNETSHSTENEDELNIANTNYCNN